MKNVSKVYHASSTAGASHSQRHRQRQLQRQRIFLCNFPRTLPKQMGRKNKVAWRGSKNDMKLFPNRLSCDNLHTLRTAPFTKCLRLTFEKWKEFPPSRLSSCPTLLQFSKANHKNCRRSRSWLETSRRDLGQAPKLHFTYAAETILFSYIFF